MLFKMLFALFPLNRLRSLFVGANLLSDANLPVSPHRVFENLNVSVGHRFATDNAIPKNIEGHLENGFCLNHELAFGIPKL
jgi:hypothetical protein